MLKIPCEKCKKKIDVRATICPYCQTQYSPDQIKSRNKGLAFGCLFLVLVVGGCSWMFSGAAEKESVSENVTAPADEAEFKPTEEQRTAIDTTRAILMETVSCKVDTETVQRQIDKMAKGELGAADAYSEVRRASDACGKNRKTLAEMDFQSLKDSGAIAIAKQAAGECIAATQKRIKGLQRAQTYMDGDAGLSAAADYRDNVRSALNDEAACRLTLAGIPAHFRVPESETQFLH